jgi:hypothetical protein
VSITKIQALSFRPTAGARAGAGAAGAARLVVGRRGRYTQHMRATSLLLLVLLAPLSTRAGGA